MSEKQLKTHPGVFLSTTLTPPAAKDEIMILIWWL